VCVCVGKSILVGLFLPRNAYFSGTSGSYEVRHANFFHVLFYQNCLDKTDSECNVFYWYLVKFRILLKYGRCITLSFFLTKYVIKII